MYKYLEIKEVKTNEISFRMDISEISQLQANKAYNDVNKVLNHDKYSLDLNESEIELPKI